MDYKLGDILVLKKPHPCFKRTNEFKVIRLGADIRIECLGCHKTFLIPREELINKIDHIKNKS